MLKRKLPSLLALRHFESVGRNLSFTIAANELSVTQAAVSHQVRSLEEDIGVRLFNRMHQRIELTPAGQRLLEVSTEMLDQLADAIDDISGRTRADRIHICVTPLVSAFLIMPHLNEYVALANTAEIILHHSLEPPKEKEDRYDLTIFFKMEESRNPEEMFLFKDILVPVCSVDLLKKFDGSSPTSLLSTAGIIHESRMDFWASWCQKAGIDPKYSARGIVIDDPATLSSAAAHGQGVILGSYIFLQDHFSNGSLVMPFGLSPSVDVFYYLVCKPKATRRKPVANLRKWLIEKSGGASTKLGLN
jgi:LysR family glycine cleavage system transcriptional activator